LFSPQPLWSLLSLRTCPWLPSLLHCLRSSALSPYSLLSSSLEGHSHFAW
jgi:hypothetical protein